MSVFPEYAKRCRQCNKVYSSSSDPTEKAGFCSGYCKSNWEHENYYRELRNAQVKKEVKRELDAIKKKYSNY